MAYESGCGVPDHREVPDWSDGSTKARRRFQSVNVTFQARPPREMIRGPSTLREDKRVDGPDLVPTVQDRELGVSGEHRQHL